MKQYYNNMKNMTKYLDWEKFEEVGDKLNKSFHLVDLEW